MLIGERVDRVLREQLGSGYQWHDYTPLLEGGLELDSVDVVEFVMRLEEEFSLPIPDDACEGLASITVGELSGWLEAQLESRPALFAA